MGQEHKRIITNASKQKLEDKIIIRDKLGAIVWDVRTIIRQQNEYIYIPDLREVKA